jgi:replicative DNA helicase
MFNSKVPVAEDIERKVLASALYSTECADVVVERCIIQDFYSLKNRNIFEAIKTLRESNQPAEYSMVGEWLSSHNKPMDDLYGDISTVVNVEPYIRLLKEKTILRGLMKLSMETYGKCVDAENIQEIIDETEAGIYKVTQAHIEGDFVSIAESMPRTAEIIATRKSGEIVGVPTGFNALDDLTGGFHEDNMIIIGGRPSTGKTAIMGQMAVAAAKLEYPIGIFSLEMSKEEINQRLLSNEAKVNLHLMRNGLCNAEEHGRIREAMGVVAQLPVYVDETPGRTMAQIKSRARSMISKRGVRAIFIDHAHLVDKDTDMKYLDGWAKIEEVSKRVKRMSKELHIPVIMLWQLSRELARRTSKTHRPNLSDLRGAGEQDADLVIFIHREEMFLPEFSSRKADEEERKKEIDAKIKNWEAKYRDRAEIIIGKQRNGPVGIIDIGFQKMCARFYEGEAESAW